MTTCWKIRHPGAISKVGKSKEVCSLLRIADMYCLLSNRAEQMNGMTWMNEPQSFASGENCSLKSFRNSFFFVRFLTHSSPPCSFSQDRRNVTGLAASICSFFLSPKSSKNMGQCHQASCSCFSEEWRTCMQGALFVEKGSVYSKNRFSSHTPNMAFCKGYSFPCHSFFLVWPSCLFSKVNCAVTEKAFGFLHWPIWCFLFFFFIFIKPVHTILF